MSLPHFSPRELDILRLYPVHGNYKGIAWALGIKKQTIANYIKAILEKMDAASLGQAVVLYERAVRSTRQGFGL